MITRTIWSDTVEGLKAVIVDMETEKRWQVRTIGWIPGPRIGDGADEMYVVLEREVR